jgi:hypothetical protein
MVDFGIGHGPVWGEEPVVAIGKHRIHRSFLVEA